MTNRSILSKEQSDRLIEIDRKFRRSPKVLLTGGLGSGKTVTAVAWAISHLPAVFICSSYPAVDELLKALEKFFPDQTRARIIVKPEGLAKACRIPGCRHRKVWDPRRLSGAVTKESIPREYCPYASLLALSNERADLVVTHHAVLQAGLLDFDGGVQGDMMRPA